MTTFLGSDYHFNHERIMEFCPDSRPYSSLTEMNEGLIEQWNAIVGQGDTVWFLGDFAFGDKQQIAASIFARLNGRKHLIRGNHDDKRVQAFAWESIHDLFMLKEKIIDSNGEKQTMRAVLCHYPLETWEGAHRGVLHFHGHSHGSLKRVIPHRFDVGIDARPAGPTPFRTLWDEAQGQAYNPQDHHE